MTNYINEENMGYDATADMARTMAKWMADRGWDVKYGPAQQWRFDDDHSRASFEDDFDYYMRVVAE